MFPFLSSTVKCVAPTALGTSTSVLGESASTLKCAGLPTMIELASFSSLIISDLSGVRRTAECVVCDGRGAYGSSAVVMAGNMSINFAGCDCVGSSAFAFWACRLLAMIKNVASRAR